MSYHDRWPRRVRAARRLARAALVAEVWRRGRVVPAYWWDGHPNFGDDLTPWLLPAYGLVPVHRMPQHALLAGVGSVLEFLPPEFDGAIWGSGLMSDAPHPLPRARALAVRGPLTRDRIGATGEPALGTPDCWCRVGCRARPRGGRSASSRTATIDPTRGSPRWRRRHRVRGS